MHTKRFVTVFSAVALSATLVFWEARRTTRLAETTLA